MKENKLQGISAGDKSFINTGKIETSEIVNLSNIKGDITNSINQIPSQKTELKSLLNQLYADIKNSKTTTEDRTNALVALQTLASLAAQPSSSENTEKANRKLTFLRGLPIAADIATITGAIAQFFL